MKRFSVSMRQNVKDTNRGGLRTISCQAEKLPARKDAQRKPPLPHLTGS
jgi:hypothetical protein